MSALDQDYKYFNDNISYLISKHNQEFVIVKDCTFRGFYKTLQEAMIAASAKFENEAYLIREISSSHRNYANAILFNILQDEVHEER